MIINTTEFINLNTSLFQSSPYYYTVKQQSQETETKSKVKQNRIVMFLSNGTEIILSIPKNFEVIGNKSADKLVHNVSLIDTSNNSESLMNFFDARAEDSQIKQTAISYLENFTQDLKRKALQSKIEVDLKKIEKLQLENSSSDKIELYLSEVILHVPILNLQKKTAENRSTWYGLLAFSSKDKIALITTSYIELVSGTLETYQKYLLEILKNVKIIPLKK